MIALDTNVLVRYLVADDAAQASQAKAFIEGAADRGERLFIGHIVLCELAWVLAAAYDLPRDELVAVIADVIRTSHFHVEAPDLAGSALHRFQRGAADFADYLIAERASAAGCESLASFDRALLSEVGVVHP